jgi:uncharacterized protein YjbI with pentapeptide repeats
MTTFTTASPYRPAELLKAELLKAELSRADLSRAELSNRVILRA